MLVPQLQCGLRQRSLSTPAVMATRASLTSMLPRPSASAPQSRSFWGWRRQQQDYASHIDPLFHRFTRYRTLKTRAKLLDKLRRRGRWDWDVHQRPFFNPRQVRLASHIGRPRWRHNEDGSPKKDQEQAAQDDGFELSQREKEWKVQMEAMRKRIEQDPYEAVFGKRFEPFWSPLVPTWMREEMGLDRWPKPKASKVDNHDNASSDKPSSTLSPTKNSSAEQHKLHCPRRDSDSETESPNGQLTSYVYPEKKGLANKANQPETPNGQLTSYSYGRKKLPTASTDPESPNGQLTSYSYSASTSWDSWTEKAKREEWDSISRRTRRYEYDPITNRMVQVDAPPTPDLPQLQRRSSQKQEPSSQAASRKAATETKAVDEKRFAPVVVDTQANTSSDRRQAIPVPTKSNDTTGSKTSVYFPSLINSSVPSTGEQVAVDTKKGAPEEEVETLTADEVRASVGKTKENQTAVQRVKDRLAEMKKHRVRTGQSDPRTLLIRELGEWKQKRDDVVKEMSEHFRDEHSLFHVECQKIALRKLEEEIVRTAKEVQDVDTNGKQKATANDAARAKFSSLQPSLERMQTKELLVTQEPDDSAAHESTGEQVDYAKSNVPKDWEKQADLLQADRVQRTRGSDDLRKDMKLKTRWIDVMNARKAAYDARKAAEQRRMAIQARIASENAKSQKVDSMLAAEIEEQKLRMQAYEGRHAHRLRKSADTQSREKDLNSERERYQQKIRDLRNELDTAFKQSSVSAEIHLERIHDLEAELEKARKTGSSILETEKARYVEKLKAQRDELDTSFKQSSINAEMQVKRIRDLERALDDARNTNPERVKGAEARQAEGDFDANVTKYAKDSSKWYKRPHYTPTVNSKPSQETKDTKDKKSRDQALIDEIRGIYESNFGLIDVYHHQPWGQTAREDTQKLKGIYNVKASVARKADNECPSSRSTASKPSSGIARTRSSRKPESQVDQVEPNVDLGSALADYEKALSYHYQKDNLEAEITADEQYAHEIQGLATFEAERKAERAGSEFSHDVHGSRIVDGGAPHIILNEVAAKTESSENKASHKEAASQLGIKWEEPPSYKVLAYDSGNDMFSIAVTSSNFTGKEKPISIPEALSQLYQPSRFVPHFAELQREGYQVIYGTRDLLVFKKVKAPSIIKKSAQQDPGTLLQDYGFVKPKAMEQKRINPIDGTHLIEPNTGSFASPTGFVGDRWDAIASEGRAQSPSTVSKPVAAAADSSDPKPSLTNGADDFGKFALDDHETRHHPRVKREEHVFSGSSLRERKHWSRRYHGLIRGTNREQKRKWDSHQRRRTIAWALSVGLGASGVAYLVGAVAERKEQMEMERWQQILEGKRARWE